MMTWWCLLCCVWCVSLLPFVCDCAAAAKNAAECKRGPRSLQIHAKCRQDVSVLICSRRCFDGRPRFQIFLSFLFLFCDGGTAAPKDTRRAAQTLEAVPTNAFTASFGPYSRAACIILLFPLLPVTARRVYSVQFNGRHGQHDG